MPVMGQIFVFITFFPHCQALNILSLEIYKQLDFINKKRKKLVFNVYLYVCGMRDLIRWKAHRMSKENIILKTIRKRI